MSPSRNPEAPEVQNTLSPETASIRPVRKRAGFFVPVNPETGIIDASRAKPEQLEALRQSLGIKAEEKERPKADISPKLISHAYSLLEVVIQQAGKLLLKWPKELASEMEFSPAKKAELAEATKELADKYAPVWLIDNQELAAFGMAFTSAMNDMVNHATERYMIKVLQGQAPPPPGFKFPTPPTHAARPQVAPQPVPEPPPAPVPIEVQPAGSNGGGTPVIPIVKVRPSPQFVPSPPAGAL
jgi:hypothetical protein